MGYWSSLQRADRPRSDGDGHLLALSGEHLARVSSSTESPPDERGPATIGGDSRPYFRAAPRPRRRTSAVATASPSVIRSAPAAITTTNAITRAAQNT